MRRLAHLLCLVPVLALAAEVRYFDVPRGSHPHDVAPAPDGSVWYTAQATGALGRLDPATGKTEHIPLGKGSAPHGVIVGPDGAAWVTDGGQNAIVRVDPATKAVTVFPLPKGTPYANLNTEAFDRNGILWYTGQSGYYGRVDPRESGESESVGVAARPQHVRHHLRHRRATSITRRSPATTSHASIPRRAKPRRSIPPTKDQGSRRVWSDSKGRIWVSEWTSGNLSRYDPKDGSWHSWRPAGPYPHTYAVWVDDKDAVWISEWVSNSVQRFDPATEKFEIYPSDVKDAGVRQILGRGGETWGAESGNDRLVRIVR